MGAIALPHAICCLTAGKPQPLPQAVKLLPLLCTWQGRAKIMQ